MWFLKVSVLAVVSAASVWATGRESIPTPQTIQLSSRATPKGASLKSRALSSTTIPLANFFLGTDLQWYGNISVGTPPQNLSVVFDTGSVTLEFVSTACGAPCANQKAFDPAQSSTFVDTRRTQNITFSTGVGVDPVVGANYQLLLRSARDTVSIGGLSAPNVDLFVITNQTEKFAINPFSGIQGMSSAAEGVFTALVQQGLPSLFSLFLTPNSFGQAEMTLGGFDSSKFQGNLTYATLPSNAEGFWMLPSPQLSVNGQTSPLLQSNRTIIFDSGTSNILFSTNTTNAIYALISPDIKPNPDEPGTYGIPCSSIPSLAATIDITFTAQNGSLFNLTIPSNELSVGPFANNASLCQTLINAFDGLELVGGSLLKHYYSVWDVGGQRMGFAPSIVDQKNIDQKNKNDASRRTIPMLKALGVVTALLYLGVLEL